MWPLRAALLLFAPAALDMLPGLGSSVPVVICGPVSEMERAFSLGAADFLISPLITKELTARVSRLLYSRNRRFSCLEFSGLSLKGKKGRVTLGFEDARFLETLLYHRGEAVSRAALRDLIWPDLDHRSRMPDMAVSRLRRQFRKLGADEELIRTVRGFGYMFQNEP
jgi:two-component system phosphate regulon response regulator PhoB